MGNLGIDTSNYTTSAAFFDGTKAVNCSKLLSVRSGELGLRQSDALFQHVKRMPEILEELAQKCALSNVTAVAASTRPRAVEGSYMPCFLAGESQGRSIATMLNVPFYSFSHQQGHIAAVLWSSKQMHLMDGEFLAWHLSGGTTELLHVFPGLNCEIFGGTTDISAGQLIDRTGKLLALDFPAGKALDALAEDTESRGFSVRVTDSRFSLSGVENKVMDMKRQGSSAQEIAAFTLTTCANAVQKATAQAQGMFGRKLPVVFTGGVASNTLLRKRMEPFGAVFGEPCYSTDNALGIAVLAQFRELGL